LIDALFLAQNQEHFHISTPFDAPIHFVSRFNPLYETTKLLHLAFKMIVSTIQQK